MKEHSNVHLPQVWAFEKRIQWETEGHVTRHQSVPAERIVADTGFTWKLSGNYLRLINQVLPTSHVIDSSSCKSSAKDTIKSLRPGNEATWNDCRRGLASSPDFPGEKTVKSGDETREY